jgi:alpha-ketoglutarate-dependent taurine dioxygenase
MDPKKSEVSFEKFRGGPRRAVRMSRESMLTTSYLKVAPGFPLVMQPAVENVNLVEWAAANRQLIDHQLLAHGAILFRDFGVESAAKFEQFTKALSTTLLDYKERAAPRSEVMPNIYTSTEYPADQPIPLHHEMSYSHNWPTKIWFFCAQPAMQGGRTPIASDRKVFPLIDPALKKRFIEKRVMYVRNYGEGVDLPWQDVFQTESKAAVETYCHKSHMTFEWRDHNRLRTRQVRQAVATHPITGETVWFNHAHLFHESNLELAVREALRAEFWADEFPRNAFYGDGSLIEDSVLDEIREIYRQAAISFEWKKGDVLMLDNFLASHGREPYAGDRRILVALAELYTNPEIGRSDS